MARAFPTNIRQPIPGKLIVEEYHPGFNQVYFVPPIEELKRSGMDSDKPESHKRIILDINEQDNYVCIYPLNTLAGHNDFLKQKYDDIESITLDGFDFPLAETSEEVVDMLEEFPSAFVKDFDFGLGLLKEYRFLIHILEDFRFKHLVISKVNDTNISKEDGVCTLKFQEFETIRKALNKITRDSQSASRKVKQYTTNNYLSRFLNDEEYPQKQLVVKDSALEKLIVKASAAISTELSKSDQKEAVELVNKNRRAIVKDNPDIALKLQNDLELISLEKLIEKYQEMMDKNLSESHWQKLFSDNPFILSMAFGYPVIKIQDQASVGGRKLSGAGEKITDFLVKNSITNNSALFEIKTPQTRLLNKTMYRGELYVPSSDLSGSINQALDQKYKFQKEISTLKENTRIYDIETYYVHCVLVIGRIPEGEEQKKSFEIFRKNSKDVDVVTFDELFTKLKQLYEFLSDD